MSSQKQKGRIVQKYYKIIKKLGEGAFGQIYLATNTLDNSQVALKIQSVLSKRSQLLNQSRFIIDLLKSKRIDQQVNIPNVYSIGKQGNFIILYQYQGNSYIMIMDILGNSLQDLFSLSGRKFTIKTTVLIGYQMLKLITFIHSKGILHRDIKPDNFLIGKKKNMNKIYMIDFGLAKKYIDKNNQHIPYRDNKDLTGTARYASINTHLGIQQGRRDDLQSWIYVLIYFAKGQLPWQNMRSQHKKQKYSKIMEKKLTVSISTLVQGLPKQFQQIISYIRTLYFNSQPDYKFLFDKLESMAQKQEFSVYQKDFDWIKILQEKARRVMAEKIEKEKQMKKLIQLKQQRRRSREDKDKKQYTNQDINYNNDKNNNNNDKNNDKNRQEIKRNKYTKTNNTFNENDQTIKQQLRKMDIQQ